MATLSNVVEQALHSPGPYHHVQSHADDPGFFFTEYYLSRRNPELEDFVRKGPLSAIVGALLEAQRVRFFFDGLFVKEPGTTKASQWHQDQPYYPVDGSQVVVIWLPLDPVGRRECLQIIRGSHLSGKWYQPVLFRNDHELAIEDPRYEPLPDFDGLPDQDFLAWDLSPGDCVAFHGMSLHGATGNPTTRRRRAFSTTWLGPDTHFCARRGELEPHFAGLSYAEGASLDDDSEFPLVWENA